MVALVPGKTVRSKSPSIKVDAGLAVGTHVIALTVVDNSGNESAPARLAVTVQERRRVPIRGTTDTTMLTDALLDSDIAKTIRRGLDRIIKPRQP